MRERHVIYALLILALSVPLLNPIGLPVSISGGVRNVYGFIEKLPAGSTVLVSYDTNPSGVGETGAAIQAMLKQFFAKGFKVVVVGHQNTGPALFDADIKLLGLKDKTYGVDYVNLGYKAGGESTMAAMARDLYKVYPTDTKGTAVESLPMMANVKTAQDISLVVTICSASPGTDEWIRQVGDPYKVPVTTICTSVQVARFTPYVQSKQLIGLIPGSRGGAEYELITRNLGAGVAQMDAQSFAHLLILGLIVVGNVRYTASRKRGTAQ